MRPVHADSCLDSEQIDTLFVSVGGQEGGFGGWVVIFSWRPKFGHACLQFFLLTPPAVTVKKKSFNSLPVT